MRPQEKKMAELGLKDCPWCSQGNKPFASSHFKNIFVFFSIWAFTTVNARFKPTACPRWDCAGRMPGIVPCPLGKIKGNLLKPNSAIFYFFVYLRQERLAAGRHHERAVNSNKRPFGRGSFWDGRGPWSEPTALLWRGGSNPSEKGAGERDG
jgi:hypothetical protein